MNTTEIVEAIKTLNLTFDGNLNSETLSEIFTIAAPYITFYFIKEIILTVVGWVAFCYCTYWVAKSTMAFWKKVDQ